jgi:hypothetical protein
LLKLTGSFLETYTVVLDGEVKSVIASNPLSACKKAFRCSDGHWEELPNGRVEVLLNEVVVMRCGWVDNG